jgi:hypothetical protein
MATAGGAASAVELNMCEGEMQAFDDEKMLCFLLFWTAMHRRTK